MDKLDTTQLEQLKAIGAFLYQVRQDQERSLEEIAAKTYIPLRLLKALEAGQEQILPEPVFIQGFIRRYGDALGIDGMALAQQFPIHVPIASHHDVQPKEATEVHQPTPQQTAVIDSPPSRRTDSSPGVQPASFRYWIAGGIAVVVLGGLALLLGRSGSESSAPTTAQSPVSLPDEELSSSSASSDSSAASPAPSASASPAPVTSPSASPAAVASSASPTSPAASASDRPVQVDVSLTGDSWLEVTVDGRVEYEGILQRGTKRTWSANREVTIVAGNAGAVMVALNEAPAEAMGGNGLVEEKSFTARATPTRTPSSD